MNKYFAFLIVSLSLAATVHGLQENLEDIEEDIYASLRSAASRQPSFSTLKTPLKARVIDRRFYTKEAMYLANEMNQTADPFLSLAEAAGLPVKEDLDFQYITGVESYWYSRYNMQALIGESRLGVALVHGPYVTEKAIQLASAQYNRDRAENELSNKEVLFQHLVPAYLSLTGFPRRFEDGSPLMLEYASGDPHLIRPVDHDTHFELAENLWKEKKLRQLYGDAYQPPTHEAGEGGNDFFRYRIAYRDNFESLRWSNDRMDHFLDMGGVGQTLMKAVLWMEYFFRQTHHGKFFGIDPEEGFRGAILNLASVSKMLLMKAALLYDGKKLTGVNPFEYHPQDKLCYFPHQISVKSRYIGDLPPRPEKLKVRDPSSRLFDQASLLWGLSEYFYFMDPKRPAGHPYHEQAYPTWNKVFGDNFPYDGSLMERKYMQLARGLANLVLRNIDFMHGDPQTSVLVSEWTPQTEKGSSVSVPDLGMTIVALANYHRVFQEAEPELARLAGNLLETQAHFLAEEIRTGDGSLAEGIDVVTGAKLGNTGTLLSQAFAVRGLLSAYHELGDLGYLRAAKKAYGFMNQTLWDPTTGVYRSSPGAQVSLYTPLNLGAALGAMREYTLATGDVNEYQRFKRFWVQAVNSSGIQQAEYEETGDDDLTQADSDNDGIPRIEAAGGKYGIAPVYAARVEIETPLAVAPVELAEKR
ncbi:hypothetical protein MYX78_02535 [Acidobacteria bacterium AH-259-G07]|nr:hypothetical protein [Acidobacteria bacterium AH-259-G07]